MCAKDQARPKEKRIAGKKDMISAHNNERSVGTRQHRIY
jgi:hypothetical protein